MLFPEPLLDRVVAPVLGKALNGTDVRTISLNGKDHA
jgi:hypothetical protein